MIIFKSISKVNLIKKVNSKILSLIYKHKSIPFRDQLLRLWSFESADAIALRKNCLSCKIATVLEATSYSVAAPVFIDGKESTASGCYEPINAYRFRRALISAYSPVYSIPGQLIFPDSIVKQCGRIYTDSSCLFRYSTPLLRKTRPNRFIKRGIHVGGAGAFNWFHFILECLPKLLLVDKLSERFRDYPVLAPIECEQISSFREAFSLIAKGKKAIFLDKAELALVDDLVVFDEVSTAPFNMVTGVWPRISDYRQSDQAILDLVEELRRGFPAKNSVNAAKGSRIFLERPKSRRSYNQEELIEIALDYGFEPVSPELLSLSNQADLFAGASAVIGASGAAWTGIIFASQPIIGLSWLPAEYKGFCSYASLASLLGHELRFIECKPSVDLKSTADAYSASYTVDPQLFRKSLKRIVDHL